MTDSAPDLVAVVEDAVVLAYRRLRHRAAAWWRDPAEGGGRTRAEVVGDLVAALVRLEQEVGPLRAPPGYERPPPPARPDVLVDQFCVVTYDLLLALRDHPDDGVAARAVAECLLATYDVDPRPLPGAYLDAALAHDVGALRGRLERLPRLRDA